MAAKESTNIERNGEVFEQRDSKLRPAALRDRFLRAEITDVVAQRYTDRRRTARVPLITIQKVEMVDGGLGHQRVKFFDGCSILLGDAYPELRWESGGMCSRQANDLLA